MYGYDHITSTFMPSAKVTIGGSNLRQRTILKVKRTLCSVGAFEEHYSFFSPSDLDEMGFAEDARAQGDPHHESVSGSVLMRTTLAPQMIHAMGRNQKRHLRGHIFEIEMHLFQSLPLTEYPEERRRCASVHLVRKRVLLYLKGNGRGSCRCFKYYF